MPVLPDAIRSCFYTGMVTHERKLPFNHRLAYGVYAMLLDLDEMASLDTGSIWFGYNRRALLSHYEADHGARDGSPLKTWVLNQLTAAGMREAGDKIKILCFPRVLGYGFNPLSIIFCYDSGCNLRAVLYEVKNTFGEQHGYLFPVTGGDKILEHGCAKKFYVSPFIGMEADYHFRLGPPGERFSLLIHETVKDGELLTASWTGQRQEWSQRGLQRCFWHYPLLTFKVIVGIHWQALKVWIKGARYHSRPALPEDDVTLNS